MQMNFYLICGFAFATCLLLLVLYLPKYNNKQLTLALLIWTGVATMTAASFALAFPQDKPVETVAVKFGEPTAAPTEGAVTPTPVPAKSEKYFNTDAVKFYAEYESGKDEFTDVQRKELIESLSDKFVLWTGTISNIKSEDGVYTIIANIDKEGWNSFFADFSDAETVAKLKKARKGQLITIEGYTDLMVFSWELKNAKFVSIR